MFWYFGCKACGLLVPQPGIEPLALALGGRVLTTGQPERSPIHFLKASSPKYHDLGVRALIYEFEFSTY